MMTYNADAHSAACHTRSGRRTLREPAEGGGGKKQEGEKWASRVTGRDRARGGASWGISTKGRKRRQRRFNYPSQEWQRRRWEGSQVTAAWVGENTRGHNGKNPTACVTKINKLSLPQIINRFSRAVEWKSSLLERWITWRDVIFSVFVKAPVTLHRICVAICVEMDCTRVNMRSYIVCVALKGRALHPEADLVMLGENCSHDST